MMYNVSIIVPVYNVEKYVGRCVRSLFEQTFRNIEYIFVNDHTPDRSMQIIENIVAEYPDRQKNIRYLYHRENKGLPSARNSGLNIATGEYVFHCDSDDWVDKTMIEKMYDSAQKQNADIVYADWYLSFRKNERYMHEPSLTTPYDCLKSILEGKMRYNVWNKLIKRNLYVDNQISFPDGCSMGEDMTIIKLFCHSGKVAFLHCAYYHYMQTNACSYTKSGSNTSLIQTYTNANDTIKYIEGIYRGLLNKEIHRFKLSVKLPLLITSRNTNYKIWLDWFPESNHYIGLSPSLRIRLVQYAAVRHQFWLIRLHYYGVIKIVYGLIYR